MLPGWTFLTIKFTLHFNFLYAQTFNKNHAHYVTVYFLRLFEKAIIVFFSREITAILSIIQFVL